MQNERKTHDRKRVRSGDQTAILNGRAMAARKSNTRRLPVGGRQHRRMADTCRGYRDVRAAETWAPEGAQEHKEENREVIPMSVYKRKDSKFWWYKFEMHGVIYRGSTGVKNRRGGEGIEAKARLDVIEGKYDIKRRKSAPLFKDAMAAFLEHARQHTAAGTAKRYEASAKPLNDAFGKRRLHEVTLDDIEKYKASRLKERAKRGDGRGKVKELKRKLKPATVNGELAWSEVIFNYFVALEVIVKNPVSRVKFLPMNNEKTRVLSFEEERLYLAACDQPLYDVAVLMLETGM